MTFNIFAEIEKETERYMRLKQQRNKRGNWECADCGCETITGYQSGSVVICGDCKFDEGAAKIDDAALDDPRRGQEAGINRASRGE